MKRFAAFAHERFYPRGGFEDFIGSFDSLDEAKAAVEAHHKKEDSYALEGHVADTVDEKILVHFDKQDGWYSDDT